ncbi:hypothetical protein H4219_004634 [Mycoemilia scoparia]|uniref:Uncharacterized protein n=1 Tax=Mycoemilia scoparia TaxID=417184 RepID=A0A9W8DRJ5_9FUNG|nr:hypothetical protein H4219_004634 [Mycoemilia scoparia]
MRFDADQAESENTDALPEEKAPTNRLRRKRVYSWLNEEGKKYLNANTERPNWVGRDGPFPLNPAFKPNPPVSDSVKMSIYNLYDKDAAHWTPRKLGEKFKISIKRVEAILKLKTLEAKMIDEGFTPQKEFTRGMEKMLGARRFNNIEEPLTNEVPIVGAPHFKAIEEGTPFTAEDAAKELGRLPYKDVVANSRMSKPYTVEFRGEYSKYNKTPSSGGSKEKPQILSKDPQLGNRRWDFVFTDIHNGLAPRDRKVLVRQKDGVLRTATLAEKQKRIDQIWSNMNFRL